MVSERRSIFSGLAKAFNHSACKRKFSFQNSQTNQTKNIGQGFKRNTIRDLSTSRHILLATQDVTAILASLRSNTRSPRTGSGTLVPSKPDLATQPGLLAERIVKHLINYVSSFVGSGVGPDVALPMSLIIKWYETFSSKLKAGGVGFLEREE